MHRDGEKVVGADRNYNADVTSNMKDRWYPCKK